MNTHVVFRCTTPSCTAELRVPRADVDRYSPSWQCDACRDEEMAEWHLGRAKLLAELKRYDEAWVNPTEESK